MGYITFLVLSLSPSQFLIFYSFFIQLLSGGSLFLLSFFSFWVFFQVSWKCPQLVHNSKIINNFGHFYLSTSELCTTLICKSSASLVSTHKCKNMKKVNIFQLTILPMHKYMIEGCTSYSNKSQIYFPFPKKHKKGKGVWITQSAYLALRSKLEKI